MRRLRGRVGVERVEGCRGKRDGKSYRATERQVGREGERRRKKELRDHLFINFSQQVEKEEGVARRGRGTKSVDLERPLSPDLIS